MLSMRPWAKVGPSSVDLGHEEGLHLIWGPLADLSKNGTPAKWAHEMTPYVVYIPYRALSTQPIGLGPKYAYILMYLWSFVMHASAWVENRLRFRKSIFGIQKKYDANICM